MPTCGMIQNNVSLRLVVICVYQFTEGRAPSKEWHLPISLHRNSLVITKAIVVRREHVQLQGMSGKLSPQLSKTMKKITFPFKTYLQKGPQSIDPAVSFSILYQQGALEGRSLSCFNLPHSRGLTKEALHLP